MVVVAVLPSPISQSRGKTTVMSVSKQLAMPIFKCRLTLLVANRFANNGINTDALRYASRAGYAER